VIEYEGMIFGVDKDHALNGMNGVTFLEKVDIYASHFDTPDGALSSLGSMLRCRRFVNHTKLCERLELTLKQKIQGIPHREEYNLAWEDVLVRDLQTNVNKFLYGLGFDLVSTVLKNRESYRWVYNVDEVGPDDFREVRLEFDKSDKVKWLEVEAGTHEDLAAAIKKLGFSLDQLEYMTTEEFVKKYK